MKSQNETLKILAEAVRNNCFQPVGIKQCCFCNNIVNNKDKHHKSDCPVLLAEEVLTDKSTPEKLAQEEINYTKLTDIHTVCYKCNMIHRKDKECEIDSYCSHKIELKSFDNHGDITHAYRCEKCFQRFVPIPSDMKLEDLYYIPRKPEVKELLHIGDKVIILCSGSEGTIRSELDIHNRYDVEIDHNSTFHMFYEREGLKLKERKPEEPLVVHNVMKYKGEYYLKYPQKDKIENPCRAECDAFKGLDCNQVYCIDKGLIWKSFKDIQITDELACMRRDIGNIYIKLRTRNKIIKLKSVDDGCIDYDGASLSTIAFDLATAEELQEYFKK